MDQLSVDATGDHALQYRAIVNARLGRKKEALDDLALLQKGTSTESTTLYTAAVVAADLDEGQDAAFGQLEAALKGRPGDPGLAYAAARAYSLASRLLDRPGRSGGRTQAEGAIQLLRAAIDNGYSNFDHIQEDSDLDPIRGSPAFVELIEAGQSDRRHDAVWIADVRFERAACYGLDPEAHLRRCCELAADGYRPVALSGSRANRDGPSLMASVWHRPLVSESARDELAERQARVAVALVRLGHPGDVWRLLRDSADPRLRTFIVNWLCPLVPTRKRSLPHSTGWIAAGAGLPTADRESPERPGAEFSRAPIASLPTALAESPSAADRDLPDSPLVQFSRAPIASLPNSQGAGLPIARRRRAGLPTPPRSTHRTVFRPSGKP